MKGNNVTDEQPSVPACDCPSGLHCRLVGIDPREVTNLVGFPGAVEL